MSAHGQIPGYLKSIERNTPEGCLSLKGPAKSIHIAQQRYESKWLIDAVMNLSMFVEEATQDLVERQYEMLDKLHSTPGSKMSRQGTGGKQSPIAVSFSELS